MPSRLDFVPPNKAMPGVPKWPRGESSNSPHRRNDALDCKIGHSIGFKALGFS